MKPEELLAIVTAILMVGYDTDPEALTVDQAYTLAKTIITKCGGKLP
jgi:hypothetical protein